MRSVTLRTSIFVGGRADKNADRHFHGRVAQLLVSTSAWLAGGANCVCPAGVALATIHTGRWRVGAADARGDICFYEDRAIYNSTRTQKNVLYPCVQFDLTHSNGQVSADSNLFNQRLRPQC